MAELQKDPMTRGDFLGFGILGAIMGAILTIPPAAFILDPIIKANILGQSNVSSSWKEVGPVSKIPANEPVVFEVEFPITQSYGNPQIQEESGLGGEDFTIKNAIWLSWKHETLAQGVQGSSGAKLGGNMRPDFMDQKSEGFTEQEIKEIENNVNVLSNSCAHLGCPVRWLQVEGQGEFLCPCHGGIYDINGGWVGGPPPRGMYRYTQVRVEEDGMLYVKHEYDIEERLDAQRPYVV